MKLFKILFVLLFAFLGAFAGILYVSPEQNNKTNPTNEIPTESIYSDGNKEQEEEGFIKLQIGDQTERQSVVYTVSNKGESIHEILEIKGLKNIDVQEAIELIVAINNDENLYEEGKLEPGTEILIPKALIE